MIEQYLGFHYLCVINNGYEPDREKVWFQMRYKPTEISSTPWQRDRNRDLEILSNNNYVWNASERDRALEVRWSCRCEKEKNTPNIQNSFVKLCHSSSENCVNPGLRKDYGTREKRYRKPFFDFINSPHPTRCFHLAPNEISISKLNSDCELYSAALFMS